MQLAYEDLNLLASAAPLVRRSMLGGSDELVRPWDLASVENADLRAEIWEWLDDVVHWLNSQYVWDVATFIPPCWPKHPHIVHELGVLADQRHAAGEALTSDPLEDWHRYALPGFTERLKARLKDHCHDGHQPWPARSRHARATEGSTNEEPLRLLDADGVALRPPLGGCT